jgi:iron complex transport system substrate-binding protein
VRRATAESVLASGAQIVVRNWGGDARLTRTLKRRHIAVIDIASAHDFDGVRANIRAVAAALGQTPRGEALIARMDRQLDAAAGAWDGRGVLYFTPGAYTAGKGTLIDSMLTAAGLTNASPAPGFHPVSLEGMIMHPPSGLVLGFFDTSRGAAAWTPGRRGPLRALAARRAIDSLPASVLGCPGWFAADAVQSLASKAPLTRGGR